MSSAMHYPHLDFDPTGQPFIVSSRYKVLHLAAEHYHYGWSAEELLRQHGDLRPEEVYAALTYFYDHYEQMVAELQALATSASAELAPTPVSRAELIRRQNLQQRPHGS